jgi:hypothetical protein
MSKKAKTMTPERYTARFKAEKARLQREYCTLFKFWRACPFPPCRRSRACAGDQNACLRRRVDEVAREQQWLARRRIMKVTPASAGPPERMAREFLPRGLAEMN